MTIYMVRKSALVCLALFVLLPLSGQNERKVIRDGVRAYNEGDFSQAEVQFRKAGSINQESYEAEFNTGAALYEQEKFEETVKQYESLLSQTDDVEQSARIWHNIGNSLLEAQQYGPSIEAYKNSLRKDPTDDDTRYNLAYARQKLKEQQQQQQENQDQNQQDKNEDQQDQENEQEQDQENEQEQDGDQQEQDRNEDQQDREQENEQDRDGERQEQQEQQEQQPAPREISKEDAERLLEAIQQQEKDVKEKVDKKKAAAAKVKTEKDW